MVFKVEIGQKFGFQCENLLEIWFKVKICLNSSIKWSKIGFKVIMCQFKGQNLGFLCENLPKIWFEVKICQLIGQKLGFKVEIGQKLGLKS